MIYRVPSNRSSLCFQGARHELTMTASREFALSLLLLKSLKDEDDGGILVDKGVEIMSQTLRVRNIPYSTLRPTCTSQYLDTETKPFIDVFAPTCCGLVAGASAGKNSRGNISDW